MEQLRGLDSAMVLGEIPNVPLHIGALFIYDPSTCPSGTITFEQLRSLVISLIDKSLPILKCRPEKLPFIIDKPYWVDDENFNIDYHLERYALPQPANWATLHELAGRFHARPLHQERPLWEALFLENLDHLTGIPKGSVGFLFKIHHALADGKVAMRIFAALHTLSPEPDAPLILQDKDIENPDFTAPGLLSKYTRAYWHSVSGPFKLAKNIADIVPRLRHAPEKNESSGKKPLPVPQTPFNVSPSADRIVGHLRIPFSKIEKLQKASGCTINDIGICIIAGGLREYLQQQGELPETSLVSGMPINIRAHDEKKAIGNQLSLANLSLHTDIEDPAQRLQAIHTASSVSRKKNKSLGPKSLLAMIDNLHPGLLIWVGRKVIFSGLLDKLPRMNNTIATNVPGIMAPCYLGGAKLVDYLGIGPLAPTISLFHVLSSIHSHINITFLSCSNAMKDADAYSHALQHSYKSLLQAYELT